MTTSVYIFVVSPDTFFSGGGGRTTTVAIDRENERRDSRVTTEKCYNSMPNE